MVATLIEPASAALVPAVTRLGPVTLAVTDADRALAVWRDLVGLTLIGRTAAELRLGAGGRTLIVLRPGATSRVVERTLGLYHVAIHVPSRKDLARAVARLFAARFQNSPTDHLVTETTYLWDFDGNGIELTFETPGRGMLKSDGDVFYGVTPDGRRHSGREAVDLDSLFGELAPGEDLRQGVPPGTRIGHVHLHVSDLDAAMRFYGDTIGFRRLMLNRRFQMADVTLDYPPHILAFNLWAGPGARQAPAGASGLRHFSIEVPDAATLIAVRGRLAAAGATLVESAGGFETLDPSGNRVHIALA